MDKELPISPWPEWKIISKIGEGSFGRVYKAQRTEKGRSFIWTRSDGIFLSAWNISQASWNIMREKISQKKK